MLIQRLPTEAVLPIVEVLYQVQGLHLLIQVLQEHMTLLAEVLLVILVMIEARVHLTIDRPLLATIPDLLLPRTTEIQARLTILAEHLADLLTLIHHQLAHQADPVQEVAAVTALQAEVVLQDIPVLLEAA
jgi:hypothetical protein